MNRLEHRTASLTFTSFLFLALLSLSGLAHASPPDGLDPGMQNYESLVKSGLSLESAGKVEEALEKYKLAMQADPERAEPMARAAMLYLILDKPSMALATAEQAVKAEPGHRGAWLNKSVIELSSGMFKEALFTAKRALRRFPNDTSLMNNLATAQIKTGELNDAKDTLLMALKLKPEDSSLNYNLACTYALSDIRMTALIYLEKAFALDPSLKKSAPKDPDLRRLWETEAFKELTSE